MGFLINIDGAISPAEEACISVLDRGFLYGDSVYEVVRTYGGRLFALDRHFARLEHSAKRLHIELPPRAHLVDELRRTLDAAGNADSYCRLIVTRGSGPITLDPTTAGDPVLVILVKEYQGFPDWMFARGIRVAIPSVRRTSRDALDPAIKSGNYLNSVLAFGEARRAGCDDALLLDRDGRVTEATSANVFAAIDGKLVTPPLDVGLLAGVTRGMAIELAREGGIPCEEHPLKLDELIAADEVMLTSTLREVMPVVEVGERQIADGKPGPLTARLHQLFREHVDKELASGAD